MIPAILGRKIGMTQVFEPGGVRVPVTIIQAGPCIVLQTKTVDGPDGYNAVQLSFDDLKPHRATLPQIGHARKAKTAPKRFVREIRLEQPTDVAVGQTLTVSIFPDNDVKYVDVVGITRGKGFQGGMKRHGFGGLERTHGVERKHRSPGSIGGHASNLGGAGGPKKGKKMAGHTGNVRCTARSQALVGVDADHNVLWIRGAVPGPKNGYVIVRKAKTRE